MSNVRKTLFNKKSPFLSVLELRGRTDTQTPGDKDIATHRLIGLGVNLVKIRKFFLSRSIAGAAVSCLSWSRPDHSLSLTFGTRVGYNGEAIYTSKSISIYRYILHRLIALS